MPKLTRVRLPDTGNFNFVRRHVGSFGDSDDEEGYILQEVTGRPFGVGLNSGHVMPTETQGIGDSADQSRHRSDPATAENSVFQSDENFWNESVAWDDDDDDEVLSPFQHGQHGKALWKDGQISHKPIFVSSDNSEAHFVVPRISQGDHRQQKFRFIGIRLVSFSNQDQLVGWCNDCECRQTCSGGHVGCIFEGLHFSDRSSESFAGRELVCEKANDLLQVWGGPAAMSSWIRAARPSENERFPRVVAMDSGQAAAIQLTPEFSQWSMVLQQRNGNAWFCTACSNKYSCRHIAAASKQSYGITSAGLTADEFNAKLAEDFDCTEGTWHRKAVSQKHVPEDVRSDPNLLLCYQRRSQGQEAIPEVCRYSDEQLNLHPCQGCNQGVWEEAGLCESIVFLPAEVVHVSFAEYKCTGSNCARTLVVDGREHALLRLRKTVAFSYELLYQWADQFEAGVPQPWSSSWRRILLHCKGQADASLAQFWQRYKQDFAAATQEFIKLQQIDFDRSFSCSCWPEGITVDGMAFGFKKSKARFEYPWIAEADGEVVHGSAFLSRTFVRSPRARQLFLAFTSQDKGLSIDEHVELKKLLTFNPPVDVIQCREHFLLPFVEASELVAASGKIKATAQNCILFMNICRTAPACQFMPPDVRPWIVLLLMGSQLSVEKQIWLSQEAPLLHAFLRPFLASRQIPVEVAWLLYAIVLVAEEAETVVQEPEVQDLTEAEKRRAVAIEGSRPSDSSPAPSWGQEEAMLRTASWGGLRVSQWQPSDLGGSDVYRPLRRYAADRRSLRGLEACNKYQRSTINLVPGCVFYWCLTCRKCIFFHVMQDAESPRTIFEVLYTRFPQPPKRICMDNGCNLHNYILNREPRHFKNVRFYIDEAHYRGHKACCPAYSTGSYSSFGNSSLAEQKNRFIRPLETQASYMKQATFMYYIRYFLHRLNKKQEQTTAGRSFYLGYRSRNLQAASGEISEDEASELT